MKKFHLLGSIALCAMVATPAFSKTIRIGMNEDPDSLDPAISRTFVSSIVYESLCDRLVNVDKDMNVVPELATSWDWSEDGLKLVMQLREDATFHDGTKFDAEAVKAVIERNMTLMESRRKAELASVESVEATGPFEVTFNLKTPDVTLLAQLNHHAGRMYSPTAAAAASNFGAHPVCSGPYKFVERVEGDRIVLTKFDEHWDAEAYALTGAVFMPIPDTTVRLANVRSGDLDMIERTAPSDVPSILGDNRLKLRDIVNLGYQGITINVNNGPRAEKPLGANKLVRQALSLSLDREAINQVVFDGLYVPGNQWAAPGTTWYTEDIPVPARDLDKARALLKEAGIEGRVAIEATVGNSPVSVQLGQVVQAMAAEAGIDVSLRATEFATLLSENAAGNFEMSLQGWSGRIDPDANIHGFVSCQGANNDQKYCNAEVDELLNRARTLPDVAERKKLYDQANRILADELPLIYTYHQKNIFTMRAAVEGLEPWADGVIRLRGVTIAE